MTQTVTPLNSFATTRLFQKESSSIKKCFYRQADWNDINVTAKIKFPQFLPWNAVRIESGFWAERQATNRERTIPAVYHQSKITGRLDAWNPENAENPKTHIFWDSDSAKWIEAVGYSVA